VDEYFLPDNLTPSEALQAAGQEAPGKPGEPNLVYRPYLLARASVRFFNRKYNLDYELSRTALVDRFERRTTVRWEEFLDNALEPGKITQRPNPAGRFASLDAPLSDAKALAELKRDFEDWAYQESEVTVRANQTLDVYAGPQINRADFHKMCFEASEKLRQAEIDDELAGIDKKIAAIQNKIDREDRELKSDQAELSSRKTEEYGSYADTLFTILGGRSSRRKISSSLTKRRQTAQAKADVEESVDTIEDYKKQIAVLEKEKVEREQKINQRWDEVVDQVEEIKVRPLQKDVQVDLFGVAWLPYYQYQDAGKAIELAAYQSG
jgi:hypothetical protein